MVYYRLAADALKYIFKEIIIPASSNKIVFILAPIVTMTLALSAWAVIPLSEKMFISDINVGILYIFAISSLVFMELSWVVGLQIQNIPF